MSLIHFFKELFSKYRNSDPDYKTVFDHYFFDSKYYLQPNASIENFSILLNVSPDQLDHISKVNYNCLFETLLNEHRYTHFLDELNNPINSKLSLDSIIKLCGYDNNDQFLEVVKKNTNKSS
jgi:YesN/AraC family two-component response regulator